MGQVKRSRDFESVALPSPPSFLSEDSTPSPSMSEGGIRCMGIGTSAEDEPSGGDSESARSSKRSASLSPNQLVKLG